MKSFALLRTNVGLTTNIKVMIDSQYNLSLDSIESNEQLSTDKLKKVKFNKTNYYDELVSYFYKNIPAETAFQIKFDDDIETMSDDFSQQYDELYQYGARNIINNKNYSEEFEYFAPLYIKRNNLPKKFIVFRVDGPGIQISAKENFTSDVVDKFKTVKIFDLTSLTKLGEWLETNFKNNSSFPEAPLEMDFRNLEFCKWNGIDYQTGGYTTKSFFMDDILDEEKEIYELEKFVFDQYANNKLVFPNILNLSFLFDDEPATSESLRKWSINRYFGFYLDDLELVTTISPYITPFLRNDVEVQEGNILYSPSNVDPFLEGFVDTRPFYVEYQGNYYKVEKFTEEGAVTLSQTSSGNFVSEEYSPTINTKFRIISEVDITGKQLELNQNYGYIDSNQILTNYLNDDLEIDNFDESDVWIIEIDGIYHNLVKTDDGIKINSDYTFTFRQNDFSYKLAGKETTVSFVVDSKNFPPKKFNIYRANFTEIKDFDTKIVDTTYSRFEYERKEGLTDTDETKMYLENLSSNSIPKDLDDFIYEGEVVNIPVSSEYTANWETFKIENNELSEIWKRNSVYCRWAFQNSLSTNDYPYLLNNSNIFEDYNRSINPYTQFPSRIERNLDYFYTVNSSTSSYVYHSLHIESMDDEGNIDTSFKFELDKYLNLGTFSVGTSSATYSYDYFSNFFYQNQKFDEAKIKYNRKKYSEFNIGDRAIPNITLFRGIRFLIYDVDSIELNEDNSIENINLSTSNKFEDYKFSILLSDNDLSVNSEGEIEQSNNSMDWTIIENWEMDTTYATDSVVLYDGVLYKTLGEVSTPEPEKLLLNLKKIKSAPYLLPTEYEDYLLATGQQTIFWSPYQIYSDGDLVFNNDEYYYYDSTGTEDFWNPTYSAGTGYNVGDVVLFKGNYYMSMTSSNNYPPNYKRPIIQKIINNTSSISSATYNRVWVATQSTSPKWWEVTLWAPNEFYYQDEKVVHNEVVYKSNQDVPAGEIPGVSSFWIRDYSMSPDTNYNYQPNDNQVIEMNNKFYLLTSNVNNSTLDNGVVIYINKKWKNILVNINISDNTLPNISSTDRDSIYTDLYTKITAFNFCQSINDISNKYDFTDYVTYVVIDENGSISKYNLSNNIKQLPYLIKCEEPEEFQTKVFSLTKTSVNLPEKLKPGRSLKDGNIKNINQLNWFNNTPVACNIIENKFVPKVLENLHGLKNIVVDEIYRFGGYYMPLFYEVELFSKDFTRTGNGNYKFDTSLTDFGLMKERKFRKVNRKGSVLKLRDQEDTKSIYPMLQEFAIGYQNFFIFSGTWDMNYHIETSELKGKLIKLDLPTIVSSVSGQFGQPASVISGNQNNQTL